MELIESLRKHKLFPAEADGMSLVETVEGLEDQFTKKSAYTGGSRKKVGNYRLLETIGYGTFGKVKKAMDETTGRYVAVKVLKQNDLQKEQGASAFEAEVMNLKKLLTHPNVIKLIDVVPSTEALYCVLELAENGELNEYIDFENTADFAPTAHAWFRQLMAGLMHCHARGVYHRDIKPENLLVDEGFNLKIADFGLSTSETGPLTQACGTKEFAAPEIYSGRYFGGPADIWSCGVTLFYMLTGHLPLSQARDTDWKFKMLAAGQYTYPPWESLHPAAKDLLVHMLDVNPETRYTIQQVMAHDYFTAVNVFDYPALLSSAPVQDVEDPMEGATRALPTNMGGMIASDSDEPRIYRNLSTGAAPASQSSLPDLQAAYAHFGSRSDLRAFIQPVMKVTEFTMKRHLCQQAAQEIQKQLRIFLGKDLTFTMKDSHGAEGNQLHMAVESSMTGPLRVNCSFQPTPVGTKICLRRMLGDMKAYRVFCDVFASVSGAVDRLPSSVHLQSLSCVDDIRIPVA